MARSESEESRRERAREWSERHSRVPNSKWKASFGSERTDRYLYTFVDRSKEGTRRERRREYYKRLYQYLVVDYELVTQAEWDDGNYRA